MARPALIALCAVTLCCTLARAAADFETVQDFLDDPQRLADVKEVERLLATQCDPAVGPKNAAAIRQSFWPMRPAAGLDDKAKAAAMAELDAQWEGVAKVIRERDMRSVGFVGLDWVLTRRAQDWYLAGITPRGPVLIRVSIQYNGAAPVTFHGFRVWTDWAEVKAVSHAIELKAPGNKILTFNYEPDPNDQPAKQNPSLP